MKLSVWAKSQGISYMTAWNWFHAGMLPVKSYQLPNGTIIVENNEMLNSQSKKEVVFIYARVSSHNKKDDLNRQVVRCEEFARAKGLSVDKVYKEIASGMNDNRKVFWKMLEENPTSVVVENKDRLTRFGFTYLERLLKKQGCELIVMNPNKDDEQDLMKDMISIITSFCCRLYGLRRMKNKLDKIKKVLTENEQ